MACKKLEQAQERLGTNKKRRIQDCSTRWSSQVLMLERLIEQKSAISLVLSCVFGVRNLDGNEWKAAQFLVEALRPFLDVTNRVSTTRYPTLSMVIPLLDGMLDVLREKENAKSIPCLRTALINELNERFSYTRTTSSDLFFVATVVDPRYKLVPFTDDQQKNQAKTSSLLLWNVRQQGKINTIVITTITATRNAINCINIYFNKSRCKRTEGGEVALCNTT